PAQTLYRLVGVGLSGFAEEGEVLAQSDLFAASFELDVQGEWDGDAEVGAED
ncbi:hypothetical protein HKX41_11265, partial [Salinisphaera sp. USBA-960]|nr:hypothetical protein [Salifodinibacter halophilus]